MVSGIGDPTKAIISVHVVLKFAKSNQTVQAQLQNETYKVRSNILQKRVCGEEHVSIRGVTC